MINGRILEIYSEFQNFPPTNSIVRNNQQNDACPIYVFETLFSPFHGIRRFDKADAEHRSLLIRSIVPPPDDYIDIFFEQNDLDEKSYHIVQVKNSFLSPGEIEQNLVMMENTINTFFKNPKSVRKNLREIISETDFSKEYKNHCSYYVVHMGSTKAIRNQKKNQFVHTFSDLELITEGSIKNCVPKSTITIDTVNNFIINNFVESKTGEKAVDELENKPKSLLCNFNGYDLAKLNNDYASSLAGRNILYGQNLRESLGEKSKTYESMFSTINNEPELFLFYNNGITILCSDVDAKSDKSKEKITLKDFSIINGAQTTSTLGSYLRDAEIIDDQQRIQKLKKVFVLTKIYEINASLKEHEKIGENIRIFTNTQTPLSNRDMVSIRKEQILIQRRFLEAFKEPNAFIEIKNGETPPDHPTLLPYQIITNERLAQLCFAGPLLDPYTAKDKRSKLFSQEQQEGVGLNLLYDKIFDSKNGYLFKMNNLELDELLFVYRLHEDTKSFHKKLLQKQLISLTQDATVDEIDKKTREERIDMVKRHQEIAAVFLFHNIAAYYILKRQFDKTIENIEKMIFNSRFYYNNKEYKTSMIQEFYELVYSTSVDIVADHSGIGNVQNWTRSLQGSEIFTKKFHETLIKKEYKFSKDYTHFVKNFKQIN